ncbi:diguanylate cyclase (GGDEF)-like protein [Malaciobacter marinus]|uniref:diguanylate cyclase n=1 Tax=Malaciobacter marinus TaxID=505249 RepID=A0AB36ZX28_9BACT|nr:GGDEF domain-containing protein [Malaciobacter marinus]PPK62321.1 diguanylate cyclase (GGDEF)-like protein [Malaciobacter marinus]
MKKIIQNKTILFVITISLLTITFILFSYFTIMKKYINIEKIENLKHLETFVHNIENKLLENEKKIDYLINLNKNYKNILRQSNLEKTDFIMKTLDLDFLIIEKNSKIVLKKINPNHKIKNILHLEKKILNLFSNLPTFGIVVNINSELFFINKKVINKDFFIYTIKQISNKELKNLALNFEKIALIDEHIYSNNNYISNSKIFDKVFLNTKIDIQNITTKVSFYSQESHYLFSLKLKNNTLFMKEGENTIFIFCAFLILFLILLFYTTYIYQKTLKQHNKNLENRVEERTLQISSALKELEKVNLKLYDLAHTDFLTKTMNRRHFFMHAQNIFSQANKSLNNLCVIMIDIDNFKRLNDSYGHDLGDRALVAFSKCVKQNIIEDDIFGRLGGEEFAIVLKNTDLNKAIKIANKIRKSIENINIVIKNENINITASFGVSDIKNCSTIDEMLQKADTHLYSAKNSGKNRVRSRLNLI